MAAARTPTAALAALLCLLLALSGCGGGSSSATSSSSPAAGAAGKGSAGGQTHAESGPAPGAHRLPGHPKITLRPSRPHASHPQRPGGGSRHGTLTRASAAAAERRARRRQRATHRRLARKAGAAAPFLVSEGDNSVPTYGSEAPASELAAAEAALSRYLGARAAGEWAAACAQMSSRVQNQLALLAGEGGGGSCPAAYAKLAQRIPASARNSPLTGSLTALRVEAPHAFALWVGPKAQQYMMPLEEEAGGWKVTQLEAVAWPIGSTAGA